MEKAGRIFYKAQTRHPHVEPRSSPTSATRWSRRRRRSATPRREGRGQLRVGGGRRRQRAACGGGATASAGTIWRADEQRARVTGSPARSAATDVTAASTCPSGADLLVHDQRRHGRRGHVRQVRRASRRRRPTTAVRTSTATRRPARSRTPAAGTYYVMLTPTRPYSGMSLKALVHHGRRRRRWRHADERCRGGSVLAAPRARWTCARWSSRARVLGDLHPGGGTGDADMYVRSGSQPTTSTYNCRPYLSGNNETCTRTTRPPPTTT